MQKVIYVVLLALLSPMALADEYPTEATVRYVIGCMQELGDQNDHNLYTCICRYDHIRANIPYIEYEEVITFERNKPMPGKRGSMFRDNERAKWLDEKIVKARKIADESCIVVKRVQRNN